MTTPAPSVRVEPTIDQWALANVSAQHDRSELIRRINNRARRLGTAILDAPASPLIATGHQAQLWHPGILAKDIALDLAAHRLGAGKLHVIVDQDTNEVLRLDVPTTVDDTLSVITLILASQLADVPTGYQPPADPRLLQQRLAELRDDQSTTLAESFENLPTCKSLAEQLAAVLAFCKKPYAGDIPIMLVSDLAGLDVYESIVTRMLHDAYACASAYNIAVSQLPGTGNPGVSPMVMTREFVELPLWAVRPDAPRRRVFVDLADHKPLFVFDDGEPIDRTVDTLLPRALLFTAVMRSRICDLFIHGTGGLNYDRITEAWWLSWAGESLALMAGVTADVFLPFDAPLADREALTRAIWHRHHLPHNLDRTLHLQDALADEKKHLLAHMHDDRDRLRRREAFKRIHQINRELAQRHQDVIEQAERALIQARVGVRNASIAHRRDWCFALYPPRWLQGLRAMLAGHTVECSA